MGEGSTSESRLSLTLCMGFGIGSVGISILLNTVTTFFPTFMATVLGQSTALAGLLLTLSKIYDIGADLVIGAASDRTRSRWGRRRPYLLAGMITASLSFLMIFFAPKVVGTALILYMAAALVIYSTGYSLFAVPYIAMAGEMTDNYHERTRLFSYRVFFIAVGQTVSVAGTAALIEWAGGGRQGYAVMGAAMAMLVFLTMLLSFLGTRSARQAQHFAPPVPMSLGTKLRLLSDNRPLLLLMGAKFAQYISIAIFSGTKLLFMLNVLKLGYEGIIHLALAQNIAGAVATPLFVKLGRRIGKRESYLIAISLLTIAYISWGFVTPNPQSWEVWWRGALAGVGGAGMTLMSISMLPDTMEYDRLRSGGLRREGLFSSIYAIFEKLGYALGPLVIGAYLGLAGYISTTDGTLVEQPAEVIRALYFGAAAIPSLLLGISAFLIWHYSLDEKALREQRLSA